MSYRRIHEYGNDGQLYQTPYVKCDQTGTVTYYERTNTNPIPVNEAKALGCYISKPQQQAMNNKLTGVGIQAAETPGGNVKLFRPEVATVSRVTKKLLTIVIDNTDAAEQRIVLGDYAGEIARKLNISAKDADVLVTGNYGANTFTILKTITGVQPLDLHNLRIVNTTSAGAVSTAFIDGGQLSLALADPIAQDGITETIVNLANITRPGDFNRNIVEVPEFRFQLGPMTGLVITIQAGQKIVVTFDVSAIGQMAGMVKV